MRCFMRPLVGVRGAAVVRRSLFFALRRDTGKLSSMDYYILVGSEKHGPFSINTVPRASITPATLIWRAGLANWTPARDLPELAAFLAPPPLPSFQAHRTNTSGRRRRHGWIPLATGTTAICMYCTVIGPVSWLACHALLPFTGAIYQPYSQFRVPFLVIWLAEAFFSLVITVVLVAGGILLRRKNPTAIAIIAWSAVASLILTVLLGLATAWCGFESVATAWEPVSVSSPPAIALSFIGGAWNLAELAFLLASATWLRRNRQSLFASP